MDSLIIVKNGRLDSKSELSVFLTLTIFPFRLRNFKMAREEVLMRSALRQGSPKRVLRSFDFSLTVSAFKKKISIENL